MTALYRYVIYYQQMLLKIKKISHFFIKQVEDVNVDASKATAVAQFRNAVQIKTVKLKIKRKQLAAAPKAADIVSSKDNKELVLASDVSVIYLI